MVTPLTFSFSEMHEIAKKSFDVWNESTDCKMIDTVLLVEKKRGNFILITYEGISIKLKGKEIILNSTEKYSTKTNDVHQYINKIFEGLHKEVEQYYKDKAEFVEKHKGVTFDDVVKGYKFQ